VSGYGWDPPRLGESMPDGYSRITAVRLDWDSGGDPFVLGSEIQVRFGPWWAEFCGMPWPVTNRKAKRLRRKARRRERLAAAERRCEVGL
jgi:hypothetical protein